MVCARAELKESASESAHRRRIEEIRNGAINAIAEAVGRGAAGPEQQSSGRRAQAAWQLRSVAEVQEAEQQLRDELRQTQAQNAAILDRLAVLKSAMADNEREHNEELVGKVRHVVRGMVLPSASRCRSQA